MRTPSADASMWPSDSMRSMATTDSGSGDLPWRAPTTRSLPPATGSSAGGERREGLVERGGNGEVHDGSASDIVSHTRSAVIGRRRTGLPSSLASALEIAAAVATLGASAMPFGAVRTGVGGGDLHEVGVDGRRVGAGLQLVLQQRGVALARLVVVQRALGQRLADAHHHAALDLAERAGLVDDRARIVRRADLENPHDAGVAVEPDPHRVARELRGDERGHADVADATRAEPMEAPTGECPIRGRSTARRRRRSRRAR